MQKFSYCFGNQAINQVCEYQRTRFRCTTCTYVFIGVHVAQSLVFGVVFVDHCVSACPIYLTKA
jgi:hypothetical protein